MDENTAFSTTNPLPDNPRWRNWALVALLPTLFAAQMAQTDAQTTETTDQTQLAAALQDDKPSMASPKSDSDEGDKAPEVSGYIQFHFNQPIGGNNQNRFRIQRARISLEGDVNDIISYELDIDPRSPDHAGTLRDAFFNINYHPNHTLRLGQHKAKFGFINQRSSSRLYIVNRPEIADALMRGINLRDIGATFLGKHPVGQRVNFDYAVSIVNGAGMNAQNDNNKKKNFSGRIGLHRKGKGLKWSLGLSGAVGDIFEPKSKPELAPGYFVDFKRVGTDFFLDHKSFELNGEYALGDHEELGVSETLTGYYLTLVGKPSGPIGPVLNYSSMNHTEDVRVIVGGYHGKPNAPFRVLFNYELRNSVSRGRFYLWTLVRF